MDTILFYIGIVLIIFGSGGILWFAAEDVKERFPQKTYLMMVVFTVAAVGIERQYYRQESYYILKYLTLCVFLWVCAWTDLKKYLILNRVLLFALLLYPGWLGADILLYGSSEGKYMFIGGMIAAGMLVISAVLCRLVSPGSVGNGDIKLLMILGLYTDVGQAAEILILAFLILFVAAVFLLIIKKVNRKSVLPFAPFLLAGAVVKVFLSGI